MIIEPHLTGDDAQIALWNISENRAHLLEFLYLDPYIMEQTFAFTSEKRQLEYLAVRAMLKEMTGHQQAIMYRENRAPYLETGTHNISITHTGHHAAIMLHPTQKVGIDIERIGDKVGRVRSRFLSAEELSHLDAENEKVHLTILWAAKEALYKVLGEEQVDFAKHLQTEPFKPYLEGSFAAK